MDLISREAVIDGIEELKKSPWANDNRNGYEYLIHEALGTVKDLCVKDCPSTFEGMTNGEVIQALFPNMTIMHKSSNGVLIVVENLDSPYPQEFYTEWWNAPYQKGGE